MDVQAHRRPEGPFDIRSALIVRAWCDEKFAADLKSDRPSDEIVAAKQNG